MTNTPSIGVSAEGHVFISYSRSDQKFVDKLVAALERHGEQTWLDRKRIPDAMKWMEQIRFAIIDARACIFVISEQAVESEIWNAELHEAVRHGKRLVPVVIDQVQTDRVPAALRELQWIDFRSQSNFDASVRSMIETIAKDPQWILAHTRFAIKAAEWNRSEGRKGALLRGMPLKEAAAWLEDTKTRHKDPSLTADQVAFIHASLAARKRRRTAGVVVVALSLVLAVVAVQQYRKAELRKQIAAAKSVAAIADQALGQTGLDLQISTLLAVQSLVIADTEEGRRTMLRNLALLPDVPFLLADYDEAIRSLAFSPKGTKLLLGTENHGARLCDIDSRECGQTLQVPGYVRHIEYSDDGRYIFTAGANAIVWDTNKLKQPLLSVGDGDAQAFAVSPGFKYVAVGDQYGYGEIRGVATGERHPIDFGASVSSLAFNQNGTLLASGDTKGKIKIWEVPDGKPFKCRGAQEQLQWSHGQRINALAFVPRELSSYAFASGSGSPTGDRPDNATRIWRMCEPLPAKTVSHENRVHSIVFTDDGKLLASVSLQEVVLSRYEPNLTGTPTQWNAGRIRLQAKAAVRVAAFAPGKPIIATGWAHNGDHRPGSAGTVLFSVPAVPVIREVRRFALDTAPRSLAFSKDARFLATGEDGGMVRIWPLNWERINLDTQSATALAQEACRRLPARVRRSILSSRHWQIPVGYHSDSDPCKAD